MAIVSANGRTTMMNNDSEDTDYRLAAFSIGISAPILFH
jgi:hypothetical protein